MRRYFFLFFLLISFVFAKENYSQMSTQELIEIIGFVEDEDKDSFFKELNSRVYKMTIYEKSKYEERLNETPQRKIIEDEE